MLVRHHAITKECCAHKHHLIQLLLRWLSRHPFGTQRMPMCQYAAICNVSYHVDGCFLGMAKYLLYLSAIGVLMNL